MSIGQNAKKAIFIGSLCSLSYLAVYVARNILSSVTPQILEQGVFTTEQIGSLSSLFFISYAVGQLINGTIGDKIKAKVMISLGLVLAGVSNLVFFLLASHPIAPSVAYAFTGFFLSMIYGPMTKVVAENTEPKYATRCSLGYTFASFFGSPVAGIFAAIMSWQAVFAVSSGALFAMGAICFALFTLFEKKGYVRYGKYLPEKENGGIRMLIKHRIVKFTLIAIITGVVRTTVVFWLPTYISQHLCFPPDDAALIFTVATFVISFATFVAIFVYERLKNNMDLTILLAFFFAALCFLGVYLLKDPTLNIIFMILAIMCSNCAATMLWSRYCPSLRDTGMVSGATGFLDFSSYIAAAVSSTLFANAVTDIGWSSLILIWLGLMLAGVAVALPKTKLRS